ncbi:MAG TPA: hypothetical protein VFR34_16155 [Paracoccaceae bacterium]|nr:hypothetical protein [Paracoccaceae bacterium]
MRRPILIWTFRRSGGTSLARLLFAHAATPHWQDEALNPDRELGAVTRAFRETGDAAALEAALATSMVAGKSLKHCLDTVPFPVSSRLLRAAGGHAHMLLLRLGEADRLISLALAQQTGAWGRAEASGLQERLRSGALRLAPLERKTIREQGTRDAATLGRFLRLAFARRLPLATVFFEDLFTGEAAARIAAYRGLAESLGLDLEGLPEAVLKRHLFDAAQESPAIADFVPNIDEIRRVIDRFTN